MSQVCLFSDRSIVFSKWLKVGVAAACLGGALVILSVSALAQEAGKAKPVAYEKYDVSESMKDANFRKEKKSNKEGILKGAVAYNKQEVDSYYKGYLLPLLTLESSPEYGNIARSEILGDIERAEKTNAEKPGDNGLNELNILLSSEMKKIAEGNYQPSAAIIATQILGRLNKSRPKGLAPEPLVSTVGTLLILCENGKNDGIRASALAGLERHIDYFAGSWPDDKRQLLADRLLAALKAARPATRSARADAWLRGRTIELLLKIKHAKEAELYQYAVEVLSNPKADPILTEKALLVTGQYPLSQVAPPLVNPAVANPMRLLVARVSAWKKEVGEAQFQGGGGDPDSANMAAEDTAMIEEPLGGEEGGIVRKAKIKAPPKVNPFAKQAADVVNKRRALHETLEIIRYGFTGTRMNNLPLPTELKAGLSLLVPKGDNQEVIGEVMIALKDLQDAINSPTITDRTSLATEAGPKADALLGAVEFFLNQLTQPSQATPADPAVAPAPGSVTTISP